MNSALLSRSIRLIPLPTKGRECCTGSLVAKYHSLKFVAEPSLLKSSSRRTLSQSSNDTNGRDDSHISVSLFKNPIVHQLWTGRQEAKKKSFAKKNSKLLESDNTIASDLRPKGKPPSSARVEVSYPFSTDSMLWESYRSPWGQVRIGKLLEDLDALAGNIAFFHVDSDDTVSDNKNFPVIVTASVDKINLRDRPASTSNLLLSGQVTWTGRSSMEIRMKCIEEGATTEWLDAYVTYVALDSVTKKPIDIPPVLPSTPEEVADFEAGLIRADAKKRRRQQKKQKQDSDVRSDIEQMASNLLLEAGPLLNMPSLADPYSILLKNTKMQNASIAQPQTQNLHNRIFGGFLMKRAFELAFSNAYIFGGSRPIFVELDEVTFTSPVDVGDLLVFNSCVLYTENDFDMTSYFAKDNYVVTTGGKEILRSLIHVEVECWITVPEKASAKLSNLFCFTFAVSQSDVAQERRIRRVLPSNIDEARRIATRYYLDKEQRTL